MATSPVVSDFYGVDTPTQDELLAAKKTRRNSKLIGKSLHYLSTVL